MRRSQFMGLAMAAFLSAASAWDPFGIGASLAEKIKEAGDHLIGNAKTAFEDAVQNILVDDINPLVDKVNAMVLEDAAQIKQEAQDLVANITKQIESLIANAAEIAQRFADHEIEEIKEKIIDEAARKVEDCEDHFFRGVSGVLQKFYDLVEKLNCMVKGDIDQVYEDVFKLIGDGCIIPDACCRKQGLYFKKLTSLGDSQLYDLEVCRRTSSLSPGSSVEDLKKAYIDCQITARKFYCIDFSTGAARDYFTKEYSYWGSQYAFWSHVRPMGRQGARSARRSRVTESGDALPTLLV